MTAKLFEVTRAQLEERRHAALARLDISECELCRRAVEHVLTPGPQLLVGGVAVGKDQRRVYTCPQYGGAQVITKWKRADLDNDPEVQEIQTMEDCPTCDGSGQILGPST